MREPSQTRSQKTLDRIVQAAGACLEGTSWRDVTIQDICRAAPASVGSFYARFPDKTALLDYLDETYTEAFLDMVATLEGELAQAADLEAALSRLVFLVQDFYAARRGIAQAVIHRARGGDEGAAARTARMNAELIRVIAAFGNFRSEISEPDWATALGDALALAFHAIREPVLNPQSTGHDVPMETARALTVRMLWLHLTQPVRD